MLKWCGQKQLGSLCSSFASKLLFASKFTVKITFYTYSFMDDFYSLSFIYNVLKTAAWVITLACVNDFTTEFGM